MGFEGECGYVHGGDGTGFAWRDAFLVFGPYMRLYGPDIEEVMVSEFRKAKNSIEVTPGESVKILRELQELSQNELARLSGIPQSTISAIENERVRLGVERSKVLARALNCHPAVLVFPDWDVAVESAA